MLRVFLPHLNELLAPLSRAVRVTHADGADSARDRRAAGAASAQEKTIEQKYAFPMCIEYKLRHWLDTFLRPDAEYDRGLVTSIYFDSPTLDLYEEKRNSDYLKTKVRLRWYGPVTRSQPQPVSCFLEVKRKFGAVRDKQRIPVTMSPAALVVDPFSHPDILALPRFLDEHGLNTGHELMPLLVVSYERRRYVDPETDARIAFDTHIGCPRARALPISAGMVTLPVGVLEVKSRYRQLPPVLRGVGQNLRKEAFSKYALCYEALTQPLGRDL